ncbi:MAG: GNAT family N-acetyltransferase [bacterium]
MDIKIETLETDNVEGLKAMLKIFENVFEMKNFKDPSDEHLKQLLLKPSFVPLVAKVGDEIVGAMTVYVWDQYYSTQPLAYIFDLAIAIKHQRKGIGQKMIAFIKEYCKQRGFDEVFVQADKVDDYALDFYRKTDPTKEEDVSHFYYSL